MFLDKLNWQSIEKYLDSKKYSAQTKEIVKSIFNEKTNNQDKTISFTDLVNLLSEAKKVEKKNKTIKKEAPKATFQSEKEVKNALGKYILGEAYSGILTNNKEFEIPGVEITLNQDGTCNAKYNGVEFIAYKNDTNNIYFVNKDSQKTLKQTIKESQGTDSAKTYHNRGRVGNDKSTYDATTGKIDHGANKNSVSQVQTFASMLMNDNENSTLTVDGQIRNGKRIALTGNEIIKTIDTGQKDGKISMEELLTYLKAVVEESESVVKAHQDTGARIYASSVNLSTKDLVNIGELFKKYDTDKDGLLDSSELNKLITDLTTHGNTSSSLANSVTDIDEADIIADITTTKPNGTNSTNGTNRTDNADNEEEIKTQKTSKKQDSTSIKPENIPAKIQALAYIYNKKYNCNSEIEYNTKTKQYELVRSDVTSDIKEIRISLNSYTWQSLLSEEELEERKKQIKDKYKGDIEDSKLKRLEQPQIEDYFTDITTTFNNGRVVKGRYKDDILEKQEQISDIKNNVGLTQIPEEEQIYEPLEFEIEYTGEAAKYKSDLAKFEKSLKNNKRKLMKELNIDNDTYDVLARTALAIAIHETCSAGLGRTIIHDIVGKTGDVAGARSFGKTNIKYSIHVKDPKIKNMFEKFNINEWSDLNEDENSAIATIILLASHNNTLNKTEYQNAIATSQGTYVELEGYKMNSNGVAVKTADGSTQGWTNEITRQDALAVLWNGGEAAKQLKNGAFKTNKAYTNHIRKYADGIKFIDKNPAKRQKALEKRQEDLKIAREHAEAHRIFYNMDNSGAMGGIVFMPKMYTNSKDLISKKEEIEKIKNLTNIQPELRDKLVQALENGEISFEFGLSDTELNSLKNQDVKLLLTHLNKLRNKIGSSVKTFDGITNAEAADLRITYASKIAEQERAFRKEYQENHAQIYSDNETNTTVLREISKTTNEDRYINKRGQRRGFQHETSRGVNRNTNRGQISTQNYILATAGETRAKQTNNTGAQCLTGVKDAMAAAGIDVSDMVNYGAQPKYVKNWFDAHSEMFTPVKSIALGNGKARDIIYNDIKSLPAGYIVIFIPENSDKYSKFEGHICITNGNGQGYSDETDNLEWGNYHSIYEGTGKGEHGNFYVYKLNETNWNVIDGKLKLKN